MVAFVKVLDEVERRSIEAVQSFKLPNLGLAEPSLFAEKAVATAHVVAAYQSFQPKASSPPASSSALCAPSRPKPVSQPPFASMMAEARHSAQSLKALRRQLAWRLHPDRRPEDYALSLAEVNAAIDAALARCPANGRE